ncbi:MAG: HAD-IIIA family hydrolase [Poseidonia sp.]
MEGPYVQWTVPSRLSERGHLPIAFLDRDGVINKGKPGYVNGPDEVRLLDGAAAVIGDLNRAGFLVCVVTNQSPISRGLWGPDTLQSIHEAVQALLYQEDPMARVDLFLTCPHRFEDRCPCRKPSPGMLSLGHRLLREVPDVEMAWPPALHPIEHPAVDWWGASPKAPHPLDLMVGDRRSDMGAGWAFGARLFRVHAAVGLQAVGQRLTDEHDAGDGFQP